ncbi:glycosyltransferase family 4 protein [Arthrobacter sp. V1I9]|uniref:glycosyltransferase family 4 protein n=1 Tax=Arthrobacter sp. V1I9 TaxID=3042275 RepID=UPI0027D8B3AC|nr:glycosyltransferase family 4 protein [Arthrobacter sp. V1I9]
MGGLQRYATELAAVISQHGIGVSVSTRTWSKGGKDKLVSNLPGVRVRTVLSFVPKKLRGGLLTMLSLAGIPLYLLGSSPVRIVHTSILGNLYLSRSSGAVQVYVFHASPSLELKAQIKDINKTAAGTQLRIAVLRRLEESCLRKADAVVVLSKFSQRVLLQEYPWLSKDKIEIIPGGSKTSGIGATPRHAFQSKRLIAVRRLEWRTGIDLLIRAFALSNLTEKGWTLDIVGTGSLRAELEGLAEGLGVSDNVTFHGVVSEDEKHTLLSESQMFVLPTRAFEGFGLATVEAMAHGLVPIATSAGASPEIVEQIHPKLVCDPTVSGLVSALEYWTKDENQDLMAALSARAIDVAVSYDWEEVAKRYRDLADAIAAEKGPRRMFV